MALADCVMHGGIFVFLFGMILRQSNAQSTSVTALAGGGASGTTSGAINGIGSNALFVSPEDVSVDAFGTVYVADTVNEKIRAIYPNRAVITVAGGGASGTLSGSNNGIGSNALFSTPASLSVDTFGTVFVADYSNHKVRAIFLNRTVITVAGGGATGALGGSTNGVGSNALFNNPTGVSVDTFGILYVADRGNHKIRAIYPNRTVVTVAGGGASGTLGGSNNGSGSSALFNQPHGVSVDTFGTVYVADISNNKIRAIFLNRTVITVAGGGASGALSGSNNGIGTNALFNQPQGVSVDTFGIVYAADYNNHRVRVIFLNRTVITVAGGGASGVQGGNNNGIGSNALFNWPHAVSVDSVGTVYVADRSNHQIRAIKRTCYPGSYVGSNNSCPPCGAGTYSSTVDAGSCSLCAAGLFSSTVGASSCAPCPPGSSSWAPGATNCIEPSYSEMSVTTLAGGGASGTTAGSNDGIGSNALFNQPFCVSMDALGTVYVADNTNQKIRAIFLNRTVITLAGGGASGTQSGSINGIGSNALFNGPFGMSVDTFGTVYVADANNHKIRAIFTNRTAITVAGGGAAGTTLGSNNGMGSNALFNGPIGVFVDTAGTVFVSEFYNHKIRVIFFNRTVITLAGGGASGSLNGNNNGIGSNARFHYPRGISVDTSGTVFVSDSENNKIRAIFVNRTVTTVAGGGASGTQLGSNNGLGSNALFQYPCDVSVDSFGTVFVADSNNFKIRAIFPNQTVITVAGGGASGTLGGSINGIGSNALFTGPFGVFVDTFGTMYVADRGDHTIRTSRRTCASGYYVGSNNSCPPCGPGTFSSTVDAVSCSNCPAGTFSNITSATGCQSCPPGSSSSSGAVSCAPCPSGSFASIPRSLCQPCPAGHFCPSNTSSWSRLNCGRGFFCPEGSGAPKPCPFQVPPVGGWGQLKVQGPAFIVETAGCINHCFWNFTSGDGALSKCD
jgi:hypothetical protein